MNKNKLLIALSALALMALSSQASNPTPPQTRCNLTETTAPSVRGVRLGMSAQQLLALFPGITRKKEMKEAIEKATSTSGAEAAYLGFEPATDGASQQFAGVESVSAGFYRARLVDFGVQYSSANWRTVDAWIAKLSETFKLPRAQEWAVGTDEAPSKVLRCDGIVIEAAIQGGSASIRIRNTEYPKESEERAKAADEKKRQEIKP